jgi:predicted RNase H-like HicB family nuclease
LRSTSAGRRIQSNWEESISDVVAQTYATLEKKWHEVLSFRLLQSEVLRLRTRVEDLEHSRPACAPIQSLTPEPYEVIRPFQVVIGPRGDEFVASFLDANIGASGCSEAEALANLKETILSTFEILEEHEEARLGPGPLRQLQLLRQFIRRNG